MQYIVGQLGVKIKGTYFDSCIHSVKATLVEIQLSENLESFHTRCHLFWNNNKN